MKFLHIEFIYYMLVPLFILFGLLLTQKESQATFFSDEVMDKLRVSANTLTLKARNALFFLAGFFMIVALAEPVYVNGKVEVKQKSADILMALDISNSMLANDMYPNRLELAKKKAVELIHLLQGDRIGVIAFAKSSYLVSPLSFDHDAVAFLLKNLETSSITEQGTSFLTLLKTTANASKKSKQKYLVVFTDGGDKKDFSKEVAYAKEHNITVFIVGVATKKGAPIKLQNGDFMYYEGKIVITKLNENIADLALKTGGVYVEATNSFADIETLKSELEKIVKKKETKAKTVEKYIPLFYFPLGAAMVLILIALASMSKRKSVEVPSAFLLFALLFSFSTPSYAGLLDFLDIKEAKKAYENNNYIQSAKKFEAYAKSSQKPRAYYDAGNAYFKAKKYKKALRNYKKVHTKDATLMAHTFHNMGNAYAALGKYEDASKMYKEALKLKNDKETKENLEAVEKLLKKKKQKQQQQNNQNQQQSSQKEQKQEQKKNSKNSSKNSQGEQKNNSSENNHKQQEKKNNNQKKNSKAKEAKKQKTKKEKLQKLKDTNTTQQPLKPQIQHKEEKMSNAEEKKWLREINKNTKTFMYMMEEKSQQEDENEKPW